MSRYLFSWINSNTAGSKVVVEFGSMFCDKLSHVSDSVQKKIAIEIHKLYLDRATFRDCIKVLGDFSDFESLVSEEDMDCAMFIDSLEHLDRINAIELIGRVQKKFNKILLMIPEGNHPQDKDVFNLGADQFQTHRSTWYKEDVEELGFQTIEVLGDFHKSAEPGKDHGCIFAVWDREMDF